MLIVADTSPLNYLVIIDRIEVLPRLYGQVFIPTQVLSELQRTDAPPVVRAWASSIPSWLEVRLAKRIDASLPLDEGEAAAIALAQELHADRLLMDERRGRAVAQGLGLAVAGTLAVLQDAAVAGLIDLHQTIALLKQTTFRASPQLFDAVLNAIRKPAGE